MAMGIGDNESLLASALDELNKRWDIAGSGWRDRAREDFEKEHLEELRKSAHTAQLGMRNIGALLRQVIRECS